MLESVLQKWQNCSIAMTIVCYQILQLRRIPFTQRFCHCSLELLLSVFVARFWLPVVNLRRHSSLVCKPKQSEPQRVFPMASHFGLCLWKPHVFVWSFQIYRCQPQYLQLSFPKFLVSPPFLLFISFFLQTVNRLQSNSSECGEFAKTSWFWQRPGERLPGLKEQARRRRHAQDSSTDGHDRSTPRDNRKW